MIPADKMDMAVLRIAECMTYFPQSVVFKAEFTAFLERMIGSANIKSHGIDYTPEMRLEWLTQALIYLSKWPEEGMREVRGMYCCKFKPADGMEAYSSLPGFCAQDIESGCWAPCLGPPTQWHAYLPQPGDEPIGEFAAQIQSGARRLSQSGETR